MRLHLIVLALVAFAAGVAESILIGILPSLASDLTVSISLAGQLTSVFSLSFAISAPLLGWLTRHTERRHLLCITLVLFSLFNLLAFLSPNYLSLLLARIGMAACCGLLVMLSSLLAAELAAPGQRGRAIGLIFMGISGSLVLGVPLGVEVNQAFGWRWIFAGIAVCALPLTWAVACFLPPHPACAQTAGKVGYLRQFGMPKLWLAHLVSILMLGGHFTLFAYFAAYLAEQPGALPICSLSLLLLLIGLASVCGGYCGGMLADRLGARRALLLVPSTFTVALACVPLSLGTPLAIPALLIWSALSWMISPVVQNYLICSDPGSASAGVAVNTSAMHLGVALGAALGGWVISLAGVLSTPWVGTGLALAAVVCSVFACWRCATAQVQMT